MTTAKQRARDAERLAQFGAAVLRTIEASADWSADTPGRLRMGAAAKRAARTLPGDPTP